MQNGPLLGGHPVGSQGINEALAVERIRRSVLVDDDGDGYTVYLASAADRISNVALPTWAKRIHVEFELRFGSGTPWYFFVLPDGLTTLATSKPLANFAGTATEALSLPLAFSQAGAREAAHGEFYLDVRVTPDSKQFRSIGSVKLSTGAANYVNIWGGIFDQTARVSDFDIIGATSAGEIAAALAAGSWLKVYAED